MEKKVKKKCATCGYHGRIGPDVWCDYIGCEGVSREFHMGVKAPRPGTACKLWKPEGEVAKKPGFNQDQILTEPELFETSRTKALKLGWLTGNRADDAGEEPTGRILSMVLRGYGGDV